MHVSYQLPKKYTNNRYCMYTSISLITMSVLFNSLNSPSKVKGTSVVVTLKQLLPLLLRDKPSGHEHV